MTRQNHETHIYRHIRFCFISVSGPTAAITTMLDPELWSMSQADPLKEDLSGVGRQTIILSGYGTWIVKNADLLLIRARDSISSKVQDQH